MLTVYGSMLCPDCVECKKDLDAAKVAYEYRDFSENLLWLKEFLVIRDQNPLFAPVKEAGKIGIPCIVAQDGTVYLDWEGFI